MMATKTTIFAENWTNLARACDDKSSWVNDVMATFETTGGVYLASLRMWLNCFPVKANQKKKLSADIESFKTEDHLGAVNELAWWAFLQREKFKANPIPTTSSPTPDFCVSAPSEFYIEVSTLNVSQQDHSKFQTGNSVHLDHDETLRRVLGKLTAEKQRQLSYTSARKKPGVLVLFDYTIWSGYGTQFYRFLANFLLGRQSGFQYLPIELSALIYIERKVLDGRIAISRLRSATYYNPHAKYPLSIGTFASLNQFWSQMLESESASLPEGWVFL